MGGSIGAMVNRLGLLICLHPGTVENLFLNPFRVVPQSPRSVERHQRETEFITGGDNIPPCH